MKNTIISIMASIMTAIILVTIIPIASSSVNASTYYNYSSFTGGFYCEATIDEQLREYNSKYVCYYPENYNGNDLDVVFLIHGWSKADKIINCGMENYLNYWVNECGIKPFVLIVPKVTQLYDDNDPDNKHVSEKDFKNFVDNGDLDQHINAIKKGNIRKAGSSSKIYISGYSMGGSCTLYAVTESIKNGSCPYTAAGIFSPSTHFMSSNDPTSYHYKGWGTVDFPKLDCYYFSYGNNEDDKYIEDARFYENEVRNFSHGSTTALQCVEFYDDSSVENEEKQHNWNLFRKEFLGFLFYINNNHQCANNGDILAADNFMYGWGTSEEPQDWVNIDVEQGSEESSWKQPENIAEVQQDLAKQDVAVYIVTYYVNGNEVYKARVDEGCPIPKNPNGMPDKYKGYVWYYSKDTQAKQVDHGKGVYKDYNVNGVKVK